MAETYIQPVQRKGKDPRRASRRGAELLEFSLCFVPLLAMIGVTADAAWAVFAKSTLQRAVRVGVRTGVTLTDAQMTNGACLTDTVKQTVQSNSLGLLNGTSGLNLIKVHYFLPPPPNSSSAATDVSGQLNGNQPGNIMQVSVENFSLAALMPRLFKFYQAADKSPMTITVASADLIEPSRTPPCIGTAP
jgi:Flp pilus assembly protein TadG